jgi:hypothetical protein
VRLASDEDGLRRSQLVQHLRRPSHVSKGVTRPAFLRMLLISMPSPPAILDE